MELASIVRFLHNIFTALWIGGLLAITLFIIPGVRKNKQISDPWLVIDGIQKRFVPIAITSIVVLVITGILLGRVSKDFTGLFQFETPYMTAVSIKHMLTLIMVAVAILRLNINKKIRKEANPKKQKMSVVLVSLNSLLGVLVLFLSSII